MAPGGFIIWTQACVKIAIHLAITVLALIMTTAILVTEILIYVISKPASINASASIITKKSTTHVYLPIRRSALRKATASIARSGNANKFVEMDC